MHSIDLNCDMGEGMANDALLMPFISSANIACGYHAGNDYTIKQTIEWCLKHGVSIGAHPSFNDREHFGRNEIRLNDPELFDVVSEQLFLFKKIADRCGAAIHHVKPHGALYNMAAKDAAMAKVIANAVYSFNNLIILYGLAGSFSITEAVAFGLKTAAEAFADRTYQSNGTLTSRSKQHALLESSDAVIKQVLQIVNDETVTAFTGEIIPIYAKTICLHGDGSNAVEFANAIHHALVAGNIKIAPL
jgi:UPF0271 protein